MSHIIFKQPTILSAAADVNVVHCHWLYPSVYCSRYLEIFCVTIQCLYILGCRVVWVWITRKIFKTLGRFEQTASTDDSLWLWRKAVLRNVEDHVFNPFQVVQTPRQLNLESKAYNLYIAIGSSFWEANRYTGCSDPYFMVLKIRESRVQEFKKTNGNADGRWIDNSSILDWFLITKLDHLRVGWPTPCKHLNQKFLNC